MSEPTKKEIIQCDFHLHTNYSDGNDSIEDMILKCIDMGMKSMAITDHIDILGYFQGYSGIYDDPNRIRAYLTEITKLRRKYSKQIEVFPGAEISSDFVIQTRSKNLEDVLTENIPFFSLFLIEGIFINEPVDTSIKFRKYLDELGCRDTPVFLAHPQFHQIPYEIFKKLIKLNIGFELNEAKFSLDTGQRIESYLSQPNAMDALKNLKLTVGSDAHIQDDAGNLSIIQKFLDSHSIQKYITFPQKFLEFI